ncbi:MAG: lysophospholipid acyltransferase family protein [Nitrosomonadales bacterium]|nr:lysophospholipid acyltransferase family protein [Nitrosomonadales bacterium]
MKPLTWLLAAYDYLVLYLGLIWLGLLCLTWTLIATILYPLLPSRMGAQLGRYVIMAGFHVYISSLQLSRRCSFDLSALDALREEAPLIIAPNHPSLLDAVMIISRLPNVTCIMKADLMNNVFLGAGARLARYIPNESVRQMVCLASQNILSDSHLLLFPEGTRTIQLPINTLKGITALIAQQAGVPVQTVLIETNSPYLSKGWSLFRKPEMPIFYRVRLGRRFSPPQNSHDFMAELEHYFVQELSHTTLSTPAASPEMESCQHHTQEIQHP